MILIVIGAMLAVILGGLLALRGASGSVLNPLRSFAVAAIASTVALHILPEAIDVGGPLVLVVTFAALFGPRALTGLAVALRRGRGEAPGPDRTRRAALEVAYLAIVLHKVSDGIGLGSAFGPAHEGHVHWGVLLGIVAHTVPMAAAVALSFRPYGARSAWTRVLGLGLAIIAGAMLLDGAVHGPLAAATPWLSAIAAGLLLHIIVHDLPSADFRHNGARLVEILAVGLGLILPLIGAHGHDHGATLQVALTAALADLSLEAAPMLLAGLVLGALVHSLSDRLPLGWLTARSDLGGAMRGALVGAPIPVCSCGVLPVAAALHQRAVAPAAVVAFLLATPELGPETVALTVQFFGWPIAILRVVAALALAVLAAVVIARAMRREAERGRVGAALAGGHEAACAHHDHGGALASVGHGHGDCGHTHHAHGGQHASDGHHARDGHHAYGGHHGHDGHHAHGGHHGHDEVHLHAHEDDCDEHQHAAPPEGRIRRFLHSLDELVEHTGPWILIGLVAAAYVTVLVPSGALGELPWGVDIVLVTLVAIPTYVCAVSATPLAAVLVLKGLSPGAALAGLLLGPATNVATLGFMRQIFGRRATLLGLGAAVLLVWTLAVTINILPFPITIPEGVGAHVGEHDHGPYGFSLVCLVVLGALATRTVWRSGLVAWVRALRGHQPPAPLVEPVRSQRTPGV